MGQKWVWNTRFSKFAKNSPENYIHVKQVSIPPFLGIVGDKKWSPFLDLGICSPIFLHPKTAIFSDLGGKKMGLQTLKKKRKQLFVVNYTHRSITVDTVYTEIETVDTVYTVNTIETALQC